MTSLRIPLSSISPGAKGFLSVFFSVDHGTMYLPGAEFNQHEPESAGAIILLTPAEKQVLKFMKLPAKLIAFELCISVNTVKKHISNMLTKTGCANSKDLASWATTKGFIYE